MADGPPADDHHGQALAVATQLHQGGDSARALELLPDLVAARPDDLAVRLLLARCLATVGPPALALAAADAAVACDPTSWEAHALLAQAAVTIEPERARRASETAVHLAPHEPGALLAANTVQTVLAGPPAGSTPPPEPGGRTAGLASLLGGKRKPAVTDADEPRPRLEPRLPAALDPSRATAPPPPAAPPTSSASPPPAAPPAPAAPVPPPNPAAPTPAAPPTSSTPPPPAAPPAPAAPAPPPNPAAPALAAPEAAADAPAPQADVLSPAPLAAGTDPAAVGAPVPQPAPAVGAVGSTDVLGAALGAGTAHRVEPRLPASLGGDGAGATSAAAAADATRVGSGRLGLRVVGLLAWLLIGFRIGLQGVGGPIGIAIFLGSVAAVAALGRRVTER